MTDSERQRTIEFWGLMLAVVAQLCTLVWFASGISSNLDALRDATRDLKITATQLGISVVDLDARVRILEDRERRP